MENFIAFINDSLKEFEGLELDQDQKHILASRLDSICALLSITLYNLKTPKQNEKS